MSNSETRISASTPEGEPKTGIVQRSPFRLALGRLSQNVPALVSAGYILFLVLLAVFAPVISHVTGINPNYQDSAHGLSDSGAPVGPSARFLFGADQLGRDLMMRIIYGARVSLAVAGIATVGALGIGIIIGMTAGFVRGRVDVVLNWLIDTTLSIPQLLIAIALVSLIGPSFGITVLIIVLFSWAPIARVIRGETLALREREFIEASRSIGSGWIRVLRVDLLPNLASTAIVYGTLLVPQAIVFEATLSFLGLGVTPPTATWGNMLAAATAGQMYTIAWWMLVFPVFALVSTTLAFNIFGDALRDVVDPKSSIRSAGKRRRQKGVAA